MRYRAPLSVGSLVSETVDIVGVDGGVGQASEEKNERGDNSMAAGVVFYKQIQQQVIDGIRDVVVTIEISANNQSTFNYCPFVDKYNQVY